MLVTFSFVCDGRQYTWNCGLRQSFLFRETTTLGIRRVAVQRQALPRRFEQVQTPYGPVQVKVATLPDGSQRATPEYEDCRRLAEQAGVPLRAVIDAAKRVSE